VQSVGLDPSHLNKNRILYLFSICLLSLIGFLYCWLAYRKGIWPVKSACFYSFVLIVLEYSVCYVPGDTACSAG